jgi:hypothetical protein
VDENSLIGNKELELSHEPEGKREKDSDSQNERIADHVVLPGSLDATPSKRDTRMPFVI